MVISKITVTTVLVYMILVMGAGIVAAQDLPHNEGYNINCYSCHIVHNHLGDSLTTYDEINNLCKSCHFEGGPAAQAETHQSLNCTACHNPHVQDQNNINGSSYGKLIRAEVETPISGTKNVKFLGSTGDNSFADGDGIYDGICEVCHTTTAYHRNNSSGDHGHNAGTDCTVCHTHISGIGNHGGGGDCVSCHGDSGSHSTHIESDGRGPDIGCSDCHDSGNYPFLKDGNDLSSTNACDGCHSPGGTYDGVDDPVIGARTNWTDGVYSGSSLSSGKEKWCAGCHDESSATMEGVNAPMVIGDEDALTNYGTGYGFYKTGHGLPDYDTYPTSGGTITGAGLSCEDCHDTTMIHIDGVARTYVYTAAVGASNDYQHGYRLKSVGGQLPMAIPRTDICFDEGVDAEDFRLCLGCHEPEPFTDSSNLLTNFRRDDLEGQVNSHYYHLQIKGVCGYGPVYSSDWSGVTNDSMASCVLCHNVHGSTQLSMVRDGELVERVPGLQVAYYNDDVEYSCGGVTQPPTPADVTLPNSTGTVWNANVGILCSGCHGGCGTNVFNSDYLRTPVGIVAGDFAPPSISNQNPVNDAINIAVDSDLTFNLSDSGDGVDWATFSIQLSGNGGYSKTYTDADTGIVSVTGTSASYDVTVNPDVDFGNGETIDVIVNVDDLATPANSLTPLPWSFQTVPGGGAATVILHPSGLASNPGTNYWPVPPGQVWLDSDWWDVLDTNDGDTTYVTSNTGGSQYELYVAMDDPPGLAGATIQDITIYMYAKYVGGWAPTLLPTVSGNVNIGYDTGAGTVWIGNTPIENTGSYNFISSSTYTNDSGGGPLDPGDIDNLQIAIKRLTGGSSRILVTEVYVEVTYTP